MSQISSAAGKGQAPKVAAAVQRGVNSAPTGTQLATAFDGKLEPLRASPLYLLASMLVFVAMVLLPLAYLAIIAATATGVWWYAIHAAAMFHNIRNGRLALTLGVVYVAPIIAGALLVLFMILPLFWRSKKRDRPMWVDRREQPLLFAYVDKLCDTMRAPRPIRIDISAAANASAHIDNGWLGLINRRLVLTIGLPLAQALTLRHFTAVLAHELGHFSQGLTMRLSYAVHRINMWFLRLAYTRSGIDDAIGSIMQNEPHWSLALIGLVSQIVLAIARLILKLMAIISHALSMQLSRQAEFDADRRAARIVGSEALGEALQALPLIGDANERALTWARKAWAKKQLPDDLVVMTQAFSRSMPASVNEKITAKILAEDVRWFDTHPPLFKRVAAMKKAKTAGVLKLDAPAICLFRDYDELCKLATISVYTEALGDSLKPEHLVAMQINPMPQPAAPARPM